MAGILVVALVLQFAQKRAMYPGPTGWRSCSSVSSARWSPTISSTISGAA
jgi:hypothetical protein